MIDFWISLVVMYFEFNEINVLWWWGIVVFSFLEDGCVYGVGLDKYFVFDIELCDSGY